jgi:hypothetical protein
MVTIAYIFLKQEFLRGSPVFFYGAVILPAKSTLSKVTPTNINSQHRVFISGAYPTF